MKSASEILREPFASSYIIEKSVGDIRVASRMAKYITIVWVSNPDRSKMVRIAPAPKSRLVTDYGMIGMIGIPKQYGRYMHQYTYSLCGGWGGGKHSKNIQKYQQLCTEYVYRCKRIYIYIYTTFLWNPYHPNHPIPNYKPADIALPTKSPRTCICFLVYLRQ